MKFNELCEYVLSIKCMGIISILYLYFCEIESILLLSSTVNPLYLASLIFSVFTL